MWDWSAYTYLNFSLNQLCSWTKEYRFLRQLKLILFTFFLGLCNSMWDCERKGERLGVHYSYNNFTLAFHFRLPLPLPSLHQCNDPHYREGWKDQVYHYNLCPQKSQWFLTYCNQNYRLMNLKKIFLDEYCLSQNIETMYQYIRQVLRWLKPYIFTHGKLKKCFYILRRAVDFFWLTLFNRCRNAGS